MATATLVTGGYRPPGQAATTSTNAAGAATTVALTTTRTSRDTYWMAATATGPASPTIPPRADDHDYVSTYLSIHQLSRPSARYVYTLYFAFAFLLIVLSILHQVHFRGGHLGALWRKFSIRRLIFRPKRGDKPSVNKKGKVKRKQPFSMPSNGQIVAVFILFALPLVFCFIGSDYIFPDAKMFDYRTSFIKRASAPTVYVTPSYSIPKAWWTVGSRTGLVAFSLFPLTVLFALKSPPFAIFSISAFTHMFYDTLTLMHKWAGRLVWFVTALHVAFWTVQLAKDGRNDKSDRSMWQVVWIYDKFIWGALGFFFLTLLTVLSLQPVRKRFYEAFYVMHVILVPLVLVCSALHFPIKYWWPTAAGGLWVLERVWRFLRYGWVNGWWGGLGNGERRERTSKGLAMEEKTIRPETTLYDDKAAEQWEMEHIQADKDQDGLGVARDEILSHYDYTSPTSPTGQHSFAHGSGGPNFNEFGSRTNLTEEEPYHPGQLRKPSYSTPLGAFGASSDNLSQHSEAGYTPQPMHPNGVLPRGAAPQARQAAIPRAPSSFSLYSHRVPQIARPIRAPIPAGYALAQLLPSRMIRLTLRVPKPFKWAPGQNVLLQIREISIWQSHPFSIVSVYDADVEQEVVLLVKARKGFTKELWKETKRRMEAQADDPAFAYPLPSSSTEYNAPIAMGRSDSSRGSFYFASSSTKLSTQKPVFFRSLVDGPYGSSARVRWGSHSTVLIIAGGSGVSFAVSILTYVCECMASRDKLGMGAAGKGGRNFITQRVRFVWIVRDFAEILWVSNLIRRCMDLVPSRQLSIDIYVTNYSASEKSVYLLNGNSNAVESGELAPPRPQFAKASRERSNSSESLASAASVDSNTDLAYLADAGGRSGPEADNRGSVLELTNWDEEMDEEDEEQTPAERSLSMRVRKEGRVRREKSRRRKQGRQAPVPSHSAPPMPSVDSRVSISADDHTAYLQRGPLSPSSSQFPTSTSQPDISVTSPPRGVRSPSGTPLRQHNHRNSIASTLTADSVGFDSSYQAHNGSRTDFGLPGSESHTDHSYISGAESTRRLVGGAWDQHRQSFVRVDVGGEDKDQFMDEGDEEDLNIVAEMARPGRPLLQKILTEEVECAEGLVGIASCGPSSLNSTIRNLASDLIKPSQAHHKGRKGYIGEIYTEEYGY